MKIGYARVSTEGQHLEGQKSKLLKAGCEEMYEDVESGTSKTLVGLANLMKAVRRGDVVVVCGIDRLGRGMGGLVAISDQLREKGVDLKSLREDFDTSTAAGRLYFVVIAAMAEYENRLISERTIAGLERARAEGKVLGRAPRVNPTMAQAMVNHRDLGWSYQQIADAAGVSKTTAHRILNPDKDDDSEQGKP